MLLKRSVLDRIADGQIDLVFRRWKRPTVRTGGTLRTAAGILEIASVDKVEIDDISHEEAQRAGFDLDVLVAFLNQKDDGDVYRVSLGAIGPDPRVILREEAHLAEPDLLDLVDRLERLDRASRRGPWTSDFLRLLDDNPNVRAQDLADRLGLEKPVFKNDVRKLKTLGLTISHSPGYELSPRGKRLLLELEKRGG